MTETIAAISSGMTKSGIGIIRISGPESRKIAESILIRKSGIPMKLDIPRHIYYGYVENVSRETLDEVIVLNMPGPHSYTGEDTVEIDCHGGILMMKRVLESVLQAGARLAEPGEFSKRAFLNGRLDLAQAEAVIDIINSQNDNAAKASLSRLKGILSDEIRSIRGEILEKTAFIEAALDDPEHYSLEGFTEELSDIAETLIGRISALIRSYERGRLMSVGINTVIIGKPNAGKSSLLNALLGEERAIVTQIPGTTRDTINESVSYKNITLNLIDTAGIRKTEDIVEQIGVKKSYECADQADLILCVMDVSSPLDEDDKNILEYTNKSGAEVLFILNKDDLNSKWQFDDISKDIPESKKNHIRISAKNNSGIEELFETIEKMYSEENLSENDETIIASLRHKESLEIAREALKEVKNTIEAGMPEDLLTVDLMAAYSSLGEITGEEVSEDLVNEIFARFCMGK